MDSYFTRREFFFALAASAVVAGCSLPVGFPTEPKPLPPGKYPMLLLDIKARDKNEMIVTVLVEGRRFHWNLRT